MPALTREQATAALDTARRLDATAMSGASSPVEVAQAARKVLLVHRDREFNAPAEEK